MMQPTRYMPHPNTPSEDFARNGDRIRGALIDNMKRIHRHSAMKPGVYVGDAGRVLTDWKVSSLHPSLLPSEARSKSQDLAPSALNTPRSGAQVSFLETSVGAATLVLIRQLRSSSHANASDETWERCARLIHSAIEVAVDEEIDDGGCEVLYGRAGLLYALLLLRSELAEVQGISPVHKTVANLSSDASIQTLIDDIMHRGQLGGKQYRAELDKDEQEGTPPLMWSWHGKRYLGAAHGVTGILQILVCAPAHTVRPYRSDIIQTVRWLLEIQDPLGSWPSKAGRHMSRAPEGAALSQTAKRASIRDDSDEPLVQWCHGAGGLLILLSTLMWRSAKSDALPLGEDLQDAIVAALQRAGELVYTRGLLRKGTGLCHGVAGNVFALLAVSDVLDQGVKDPYWLARATDLAVLAIPYREYEARGEMKEPDRPYSLYEGVGGMCCAWAEVLARLEGGEAHQRILQRRHGMPGYDDLLVMYREKEP